MSLIIGLTGGIGSGKTSVATFFAELGVDVVDTDAIAHELTQPQGVAITAIRQVFGEKYITDEGALDRKEMRQLVFSDDNSRRKLEAILHPLIRTEVVRRIALFCGPYGMIVVPLLLETRSYSNIVHRVLLVDSTENAQLSRTERLQQADDVIVNDLDMSHLKRQVDALHNKYLALANQN